MLLLSFSLLLQSISHVIEPSGELALAAQELQGFLQHVLARLLGQRVMMDGGAPDIVEVGVPGGGRKGAEQERQPPQDHEALHQQRQEHVRQ